MIAGPDGPTGQAPPDPYETGIAPTRRARMPARGRLAYPCRGEAPPRPPAPEARQSAMACIEHVHDSTVPGRSPHHGIPGPPGPAGQAPPDPYRMRPSTGPVTAIRSSRAGPRTPVGARRRLARPPSRAPTRGPTAWGENGRARSSNRLKPAVTWCPACPCGLGRSMVPSPLQGACGFSPGLQPRAHSVIGIRTLATAFPALTGRRVRHRLTPTARGSRTAHPCRHRPHRGRSAPPV
jgi:hypothetical protein